MNTTTTDPAGLLDAMTVLADELYNCLTTALGLSPASFQVSVPAAPLPASDEGLWASMNVLPPQSLTFDRDQGAAQLFPTYAAVVEQLEYAPSLESVIGPTAYQAWVEYLATLDPQPTVCEQGQVFVSWANANGYSGVAMQGASNLNGECLFEGQQKAVAPYQGPKALPVDFVGGYDSLLRTVQASSGASVTFDSSTASGNVSGTWAKGQQLGVQGLWTGSDPRKFPSVRFASRRVQLTATLTHCTSWTATPGGWYSSSLLNTAYSSQATPPWPVGADPSWSDAFGPSGSLLWLLGSLVVADGLELVVTSQARFGATGQEVINAHVGQGMWPFYMPTGSAVTNAVDFDSEGRMTITTQSAVGNPFVLGGNVLGVAQYLGHAPP